MGLQIRPGDKPSRGIRQIGLILLTARFAEQTSSGKELDNFQLVEEKYMAYCKEDKGQLRQHKTEKYEWIIQKVSAYL